MLITGYLVPDTCKQILWANIICDTFCTILIIFNVFLEILSKFKLAFYYLINTCLKIATSRSCCTSHNFYGYNDMRTFIEIFYTCNHPSIIYFNCSHIASSYILSHQRRSSKPVAHFPQKMALVRIMSDNATTFFQHNREDFHQEILVGCNLLVPGKAEEVLRSYLLIENLDQ